MSIYSTETILRAARLTVIVSGEIRLNCVPSDVVTTRTIDARNQVGEVYFAIGVCCARLAKAIRFEQFDCDRRDANLVIRSFRCRTVDSDFVLAITMPGTTIATFGAMAIHHKWATIAQRGITRPDIAGGRNGHAR